MEAVYNYDSIIFMYRALDYSGKALIRVCHDTRFFAFMVEKNKEGERKQLRLFEKFVNDVMAQVRSHELLLSISLHPILECCSRRLWPPSRHLQAGSEEGPAGPGR